MAIRVRGRGPVRHRATGRTMGQSVVEFAIVLPVLLAFVGVVIDVSRLYQAWINLESGTRDAAQYIATSGGTSDTTDSLYSPAGANQAANNSAAVRILNGATGGTFTASSSLGSCSQATVTTQMQYYTSTNGGTTAFPAGRATVTTCLPFRTLFAYPFLTINGAWKLGSTKEFTTLVGR